MDLERRVALVMSVGEEVVTEEELRALLAEKAHPVAYDGFEPSGTIHIAQGLLRAINVNKMTAAGCRFKMFVADWHAWANNKMGGDLEKIQTVGRYLQEIWRATGMDLENVEFVWASDLVREEDYWKKVMNIARDSSLDRVLRTTQIMGRSEKDKLSAAQILYPCMQAADIFHLKADITQLGMDQRKVNMLAREVGPKLGFWKPVVVSHHMLMGLQTPPPAEFDHAAAIRSILAPLAKVQARVAARDPLDPIVRLVTAVETASLNLAVLKDEGLRAMEAELQSVIHAAKEAQQKGLREDRLSAGQVVDWEALREAALQAQGMIEPELRRSAGFVVERATAMKMSKSNPDSSIFMTDTPQQVEAKLKKAYCPEKVVTENPVLEYMRHIVFERFPEVTVERPEKFGGSVTFHGYPELELAFAEGRLHPMDLKKTCGVHVNRMLQPVREHFEKDAKARALKEQVDSFKVTR